MVRGKALHQRESKSPDTSFAFLESVNMDLRVSKGIVESQMGRGPVGHGNGCDHDEYSKKVAWVMGRQIGGLSRLSILKFSRIGMVGVACV